MRTDLTFKAHLHKLLTAFYKKTYGRFKTGNGHIYYRDLYKEPDALARALVMLMFDRCRSLRSLESRAHKIFSQLKRYDNPLFLRGIRGAVEGQFQMHKTTVLEHELRRKCSELQNRMVKALE